MGASLDFREWRLVLATVFDVARYILEQRGPMTAMKLQKLVYYSQAWSLVWDERPLFNETIAAWANGPVCPDLYRAHAGNFMVSQLSRGDVSELDHVAIETIDAILEAYGEKESQWLSDLTHSERPWMDARGDTPPGDRCYNEISHAAMAEYYSSL